MSPLLDAFLLSIRQGLGCPQDCSRTIDSSSPGGKIRAKEKRPISLSSHTKIHLRYNIDLNITVKNV